MPLSTLKALVEAVNKFDTAKVKAEEFLPQKRSEDYSEWLSAFMHHVNYRLSYADWEKLCGSLPALSALLEVLESVPPKPEGQCGPWCRDTDTSNAYCKHCNDIFQWEHEAAKAMQKIIGGG